MIFYLAAILACQLAGELLVAALALPLPGPVVGMAILFAVLIVKGSLPPSLAVAGGMLLDHLSLLFVPAGVGVIAHLALLQRDGLALAAALIVSTLLAIAVTGFLMSRLGPAEGAGAAREERK
ncbi:MAG: CidA/LrgA family protein [Flavobacteriaceae bacterium]